MEIVVGDRAFEPGLKLRIPDRSWFSRGRKVCSFREGSQNPDSSKGWKSRHQKNLYQKLCVDAFK